MFLFRLALECGEWDVDALSRRITVRQLTEWMAFYRLEPFGNSWRQSARVAIWSAAAAGAKVTPDDEDRFMPCYRPGGAVMTDAEIAAELRKIPGYQG